MPVAGGMATRGLAYADRVGAECVQVFVGNARGWTTGPGVAREDEALRARPDLPVFVHAPYLINPGAPDPAVAEKSVASLAHSLRRGTEIGARGVVVHTGSAVVPGRGAGLARAARRLGPLLDSLGENGPRLLLEPMAGQGQVLCATVDDVVDYLDALGWHPRAGVCLDTAHVFAAGHDIASGEGMRAMLDHFGRTVGGDRLGLVHANDSALPCGSRKDRHANIGAGHIGAVPFAELFAHPVSAGVPVVVETPGPEGPHTEDIAVLQRLRDDTASG